MVGAFGGTKAETETMLPIIEAFMTARRFPTRPSWPTQG